jgi:hypothetical protein
MGGRPTRVQVCGPLAPHAAGFRGELERIGYRPNAICDQLRLMAHASRWLDAHGLDVGQLTPARVEDFLADRRAEGYTLWLSSKAMVPMLNYLRGLSVVASPAPDAATTEGERLMGDYRVYLVQERGLAAGTVAGYLHVAKLFCAARAVHDELHLDEPGRPGPRRGRLSPFRGPKIRQSAGKVRL